MITISIGDDNNNEKADGESLKLKAAVENEILVNDEGKLDNLGRETPLTKNGQPTCSLWDHVR